MNSTAIWTIGHSNRSLTEFVQLLDGEQIEVVADVRRFPGSRRLPHFGQVALSEALAARGVRYRWFEQLGGRRRPAADSPNTAWRNASFRAYADYMQSDVFNAALGELLEFAGQQRIALMCSESLWWRCHRRLIADALLVRNVRVLHIISRTQIAEHALTPPARLERGMLTYSAKEQQLPLV